MVKKIEKDEILLLGLNCIPALDIDENLEPVRLPDAMICELIDHSINVVIKNNKIIEYMERPEVYIFTPSGRERTRLIQKLIKTEARVDLLKQFGKDAIFKISPTELDDYSPLRRDNESEMAGKTIDEIFGR